MKNVISRTKSAAGFTIIDMVAVMAVIATVSAMAIPQTISALDVMRLGMSVRDVERELQFARLKSVSTNRPMRVRFNCPSAGKIRVVEVIGTSALPDANDADAVLGRCSETTYPYSPTGADQSRLTRPNNDGPVRTVYSGTVFSGTGNQTLEFWPNGTVHTACQTVAPAVCDTSATQIATLTLTLTRKSKTKNITVNGLGKILQDR
jgi:Tfp pilus assembly protein FimT